MINFEDKNEITDDFIKKNDFKKTEIKTIWKKNKDIHNIFNNSVSIFERDYNKVLILDPEMTMKDYVDIINDTVIETKKEEALYEKEGKEYFNEIEAAWYENEFVHEEYSLEYFNEIYNAILSLKGTYTLKDFIESIKKTKECEELRKREGK